MASLISVWQLVAKRAMAHWRLLSAVALGVVLAVAVMSSTVIYYQTLRELALEHALSLHPQKELDVLIRADHGPTSSSEYQKVSDYVEREVDRRFGWLVREPIAAAKTATFYLTQTGEEFLAGEDNQRTYFQFLPDLESHAQVVEGGFPRGVTAADLAGKPFEIEVLVDEDTARLFDLDVGSTMSAIPYWQDISSQVTAFVSGIIRRSAPQEEYWRLDEEAFSFPTDTFRVAPFFVPERTFFETLGPMFPDMTSTYAWLLPSDISQLSASNASEARYGIQGLKAELNSTMTSFIQTTTMDDVLEDFDINLFFSRVPLLVVLVLIVAVVLYYVITMSSLLVERQGAEIALLRSRGSTSLQILGLYLLEGGTLSLLAVVVGPFIALFTISLLGLTPPFSDLSGGTLLPAHLSWGAFTMGLLGGALSFLALLIPAIQASRVGVVQQRQIIARPQRTSAIHRYYIDLIILAVGLLLLRELQRQGSLVAVELFGEVKVNQLLLATPAIILVGAGLLLLRIFPLVVRLVAWAFSSVLPAGIALGLWQMSRNPTHYARLSLLLVLTAGLGIFAASFGGTLERNFKERVLYSTGADLRAEGVLLERSGPTSSVDEKYKQIPGVFEISPAYRGTGVILSKFLGDLYTMLAVDHDTFPSVAFYRRDFASAPLEDLLDQLAKDDLPQGVELPEDARSLRVLVRPDRPHPSVKVIARLRDSKERYFTYYLGNLVGSHQNILEISLERPSIGPRRPLVPTPPLKLVSLFVMDERRDESLAAGAIFIDAVQVTLSDGSTVSVEDFQSIEEWSRLEAVPQAKTDSLDHVANYGNGSDGEALFTWSAGHSLQPRGIIHGPALSPLPALASASFLEENRNSPGDQIEVSIQGNSVPITILEKVDYFPTLDPNEDPFLIADVGSLIRYVNAENIFSDLQPNEIWVAREDNGVSQAETIQGIRDSSPYISKIHNSEEGLANSKVDPLVTAGWRAILFMAFFTVLLLSALGLMVHAYVSFKNRELEFGLLRTMGLSLRQLMSIIWVELVLVIVAGMALGTWMGRQLGEIIMPYLSHSGEGLEVLPPFVMEVSWGALALTYGLVAAFFLLVILGIIRYVLRIGLSKVLRLGEM